jgi:hypothetical protein
MMVSNAHCAALSSNFKRVCSLAISYRLIKRHPSRMQQAQKSRQRKDEADIVLLRLFG